jgi:hypothetical protein
MINIFRVVCTRLFPDEVMFGYLTRLRLSTLGVLARPSERPVTSQKNMLSK